MQEILVYSTPSCPYCVRAKGLLQSKGYSYKEIDVSQDTAVRDAMVVKAGGRRTVPQIFIGSTHVGGFDDLNALERAGKLESLVMAA
ncbi:MAG: glutaredoxin 3 [Rickettsiales bacterium]|nr:glutaredoxin 3 [Rickettsiales bacterium]